MSTPYFRPQAIVQGEFVPLASSTIQPQPVLLIGAENKVFEENDTQDREFINYGAYDYTTDTDYAYAGLPVGGVVDLSSVRLIMEDVLAQYALFTEGSGNAKRGTAANQVNLPVVDGFQTFNNGTTTFNRNSIFVNRDVQVGDRVKITAGVNILNSRITGFIHDVVPAVVDDEFENKTSNQATQPLSYEDGDAATTVNNAGTNHAPAYDLSVPGDDYKGSLTLGHMTETYTLEVIQAGTPGGMGAALFKVTSTKGDNVTNVAAVAHGTRFAVGTRGLYARFIAPSSGNFVVGEKYTFAPAAEFTQHVPSRSSDADVYDGLFDTTYVVTVIKGGTWIQEPQVSVTTTTGIDSGGPVVVDINDAFSLGTLGIQAVFDDSVAQGGLRLGDVYTLKAVAAKKGAVRTMILAHPINSSVLANTSVGVDFYIYKSQIEIPSKGYPLFPDDNMEAAASEFTVKAGIDIYDSTWTDFLGDLDPIPVIEARLIVPYTALLTANANIMRSLSDLSSVTTVAGKVIPANPMGYALDKALQNSGSQPVYFISVQSNDEEGFRFALEEHEARSVGYMVTPLTSDDTILDLIRGHVNSMNGENKQKRCIAFISTSLPSVVLKYDKTELGNNWVGSVALDPGSMEYIDLNIPGALLITDGIRPGDTLRTDFGIDAFGNPIYKTATIASIVDEENAKLASPGLANGVGDPTPVQVQIARTLTKDEQAVLEAANSSEYSDRFVYNVFANIPLNSDVPGFFLASAVAGFASSVVPHQPITNFTLSGFNDQTGTLRRFSATQLDTMAEGGTLIVTQDAIGGANYIRHQLSTDNTDDLRSELSVTRNLHSIEKYIQDLLAPLVGKHNITDYFLQLVDVTVRQALDYLQSQTSTLSAGPQIRSWDQESLIVTQNPTLRTEVDIEVDVVLPLPANRIKMKIRATA